MKPGELLESSRVLLGLGGELAKEDAIAMLARAALKGDPPTIDELVCELLAREARMTTGIGRGVAIPHTRCADISAPVGALGISPQGLDFDAIDGEPVQIVFVFLTPESTPALHISMLAEAVALFGDCRVRHDVVRARNAEEVLKIISR